MNISIWSLTLLFFILSPRFLPGFEAPVSFAAAADLLIYNKCSYSIWPAIQPSSGQVILADGGFHLASNHTRSVPLPPLWSGRVWARQSCSFDASGIGSCITGDCAGKFSCIGIGGTPPATLAEITLGAKQDFYDVSLVDGYNLPMSVAPYSKKRRGKCVHVGCLKDLNAMCPAALEVRVGGMVVGCRSACLAFGSPEYCCTGTFGSAGRCNATAYSKIFKVACPKAYSYAYDDRSSLATCSSGESYVITFCPNYLVTPYM